MKTHQNILRQQVQNEPLTCRSYGACGMFMESQAANMALLTEFSDQIQFHWIFQPMSLNDND